MIPKAIGGFFELAAPAHSVALSIHQLWTAESAQTFLCSNGRSAMSEVVRFASPRTVWLPAFCCQSMLAAACGGSVHFYPLKTDLSPAVDFLEARVEQGDVVICIDYFGALPSSEFRAFVKTRPDVWWIEDRAQALMPGEHWGDWVVYSPRKLLGVPDGGVAVCLNANKQIAVSMGRERNNPPLLKVMEARRRLRDNAVPKSLYQQYVEAEENTGLSKKTMSSFTESILAQTDAKSVAMQRRTNAEHIRANLPAHLLLGLSDESPAPFAVPIVTANRENVCKALQQANIYCPVHWRVLPSQRASFPWEHKLSESVLSLICDHRYDQNDMDYMCRCIAEALH